MNTLKTFIAAIASALTLCAGAAAQDETTIVILRHGEKPEKGLGQINCQGLNRALALAPVLLSRYGQPAALYAPNPVVMKKDDGVDYAYIRPLATIEPLAVRAGMPVNLQWAMWEVPDMAEQILAAAPGVYMVAWEHHWGENMARYLLSRLGNDPLQVPEWQSRDFDSLYVVRIRNEKDGRRATFTLEREGLDGQPATCPAGQGGSAGRAP